MGVLSSLISSTLSLGLPRASGHLYLVGQLLISASHDRALAITIGNACMMHEGAPIESNGIFCRSRTAEGIEGSNFGGFASFLAAHAVSSSCPDHVKSDVIYVAMELLDCCATAGVDLGIASQVTWRVALQVLTKYAQKSQASEKCVLGCLSRAENIPIAPLGDGTGRSAGLFARCFITKPADGAFTTLFRSAANHYRPFNYAGS